MLVSILQSEVFHERADNEKEILSLLDQAGAIGADLVLLPELWNTPFINDEILEHDSEWEAWISLLSRKAAELSVWIVGGTLPRKTKDGLYNSCVILDDHGQTAAIADKTHLLEVHTSKHIYREADVFRPGDHLCRVQTPWGKIAVLICFDNRFPEAARSLCEDCFALFAPCGFNEKVGAKHWQPLFQTRAMENEVFVFAANPAARKYKTYSSYGHSLAVSPDGVILGKLGSEPGLLNIEISPDEVEQIRRRSPFWRLRRTDLYR